MTLHKLVKLKWCSMAVSKVNAMHICLQCMFKTFLSTSYQWILDLEAKLAQLGKKYSVGHIRTQIITTTVLCSVKLQSGVV